MSHEMADENTPLLDVEQAPDRRLSRLIQKDDAASSIVKSHVSVEEQAMAGSTVGERLAYNDYTTIDWLHDLVSLNFLYKHISRFLLRSHQTLIHHLGQRFLPSSQHPQQKEPQRKSSRSFRLVLWLDSSSPDRCLDSLRSLPRRHRRRNSQ
jgi:hypothetical protein